MNYVPYVPDPAPSPRAHELGQQLQETIESFRQAHPGTTATDVRQALGLVRAAGSGRRLALVAALLTGALVLGVFAYLTVSRGAGAEGPSWVLLTIVLIGIITAVMAVTNRNR